MKGDYSIPPLRDLPPGRLGQRREHLLFEITRERESRGAFARPWPSRLGGPRRRRLVVLAAAALVVAVGTAAAIGGVRDFILDRGFIGVPPERATPSVPQRGELVAHWEGRSATLPKQVRDLGPLVRSWVYADGRIIWSRSGSIPEGANELTSGYLEQRLTPKGVELLRSEVVGLLARSRTPLETLPPDHDPRLGPFGGLLLAVPGDYGSGWGSVEVRDGRRLVRLRWEGMACFPSQRRCDNPQFEVTIATPEQLSALRRVDALLTDPASVLPSSAWAVREVRAYVPSHYAVCIDTSPPKDASDLLSLLPTRAADVLRGKSRTRSDGDVVEAPNVVLGRMVTYCSRLATEEAREVAQALSGLDPEPGWGGHVRLAYRVAEAVDNLIPTTIWFEPYFPHGQFTYSASG